MGVYSSKSSLRRYAIIYVNTTLLYALIAVSLLCWPVQGLSSRPAQINGVVTACRGEPIQLTCTHGNTASGNSRWIVGPPVDCAETISSSVSPGQSCEPVVTFQDHSMLSEGVVSSIATVATDNTSINGTELECRDGAGIIFNTVGNVSICIIDSAQLPVPTGLSYTVTDNGLEVTWDSVAFENCIFSFSVIFVSVSSGISGMLETNTTSALLEGLRSNEEYNISVSSVVGSSCASSPAAIITMVTGQGGGVQPWVVPVSVVVPVVSLIVIALLVILIIAALFFFIKPNRDSPKDIIDLGIQSNTLEELNASEYEILDVDRDHELNNFLESHGKTDKGGCVYYEFTRRKEDISDDKQVILRKEETGSLYTGSKACEMIGAPGTDIKRPKLIGFKVFVESKGIGHRPLKKGTQILYHKITVSEEHDLSMLSSSLTMTLTEEDRVTDPDSYQEIQCEEDIQLEALITKEGLKFTDDCAYIELGDKPEDIDSHKKVIIMRRKEPNTGDSAADSESPINVQPGDMFTGPVVMQIIGAPGRDITLRKTSIGGKWRVFVQSRHHGVRHIHRHTAVLYKKPDSDGLQPVHQNSFKVYTVTEQCELRDFVERQVDDKLNYNEPLLFFFEFVNKFEDITDDKEVLLMDEKGVLFSGPEALEMIGAPGQHINNPHLEKYRVFIQNSGGGKRSLNPGSSLLYDKRQNLQ